MKGKAVESMTTFDSTKESLLDLLQSIKQWCRNSGIEPKRCDCIVNKTPLSAKTNRMIGGNAPSTYLARIQKSAGITGTRLDEILESHVIAPAFLRADDFLAFFKAREKALLDRVEAAMGKPIARELLQAPVEEVDDYEDEQQSEEDLVA